MLSMQGDEWLPFATAEQIVTKTKQLHICLGTSQCQIYLLKFNKNIFIPLPSLKRGLLFKEANEVTLELSKLTI